MSLSFIWKCILALESDVLDLQVGVIVLPSCLTACWKLVCTMFEPCSQAGFAGSKFFPPPWSLPVYLDVHLCAGELIPNGFQKTFIEANFVSQNTAFLHVREICSCPHMFACSRACSKHVHMFGMFVCNSSVKAHVCESMFACSQWTCSRAQNLAKCS